MSLSHLTLCLSFSILKMRIILLIHIPLSLLCYSTFLWILIPCFPGGSVVKNPPATSADLGSNPDLGRSPGGGHGNPLHCFCLENPMDRGSWQATVHSVAKSDTTEATWHTRYLKFYFLYKSNASSPKEDKNEWKSFSAIRVFVISLYPFFFKFDAFWEFNKRGTLDINSNCCNMINAIVVKQGDKWYNILKYYAWNF